jgi:hypothetical protein
LQLQGREKVLLKPKCCGKQKTNCWRASRQTKPSKRKRPRLIADDLAHSIPLREVILAASEQMKAESLRDAVQVMRAATAYSTAIKNTSDIIKRSLRLEERENTSDELPELIVTELTQVEIERLRSTGAVDKSALHDHVDEAAIDLA